MAVPAQRLSEKFESTGCARLVRSDPDTGFGGYEPIVPPIEDPSVAVGDFLENELLVRDKANLAQEYVLSLKMLENVQPVPRLEDEYQKIGWWKGPHSTPKRKFETNQFWIGLQERGAMFLVNKTRTESNSDALSGVAHILSRMAKTSLSLIVGELERPEISEAQTETLLKTISWMDPRDAESFRGHLVALIGNLLQAHSADVRDAASAATRALTANDATTLLHARRQVERDPDVRDALEFELEERGFTD